MNHVLQSDIVAMAAEAGWDGNAPLRNAKPCPFCGGDPVGAYTRVFWVECVGCGTSMSGANTPGEALVLWNRRDLGAAVAEAKEGL